MRSNKYTTDNSVVGNPNNPGHTATAWKVKTTQDGFFAVFKELTLFLTDHTHTRIRLPLSIKR